MRISSAHVTSFSDLPMRPSRSCNFQTMTEQSSDAVTRNSSWAVNRILVIGAQCPIKSCQSGWSLNGKVNERKWPVWLPQNSIRPLRDKATVVSRTSGELTSRAIWNWRNYEVNLLLQSFGTTCTTVQEAKLCVYRTAFLTPGCTGWDFLQP